MKTISAPALAHWLQDPERPAPHLLDVREPWEQQICQIAGSRLLPMRIDFFEKSTDAPSKRWTLNRAEQVQGYWTVMDSTMTDLETGHETRLVVEESRCAR